MNTMQENKHYGLSVKEILLRKLSHTRNTYLLGFAAEILLKSSEADEIMKGGKVVVKMKGGEMIVNGVESTIVLELDRVREMLSNDRIKEAALHNFLMFQLKMIITEPFELITNYCKETNQVKKFKDLDFYDFGRKIRNLMVHDEKTIFQESIVEDILPPSWRDKTTINNISLNYKNALDLFNDYHSFVKTDLD